MWWNRTGDELLIGASRCMKKCFGPYGKIYKTGGDEFIATLFCDNGNLKEIPADFENAMANWKGKLIDGLSISYGYISKDEEPKMTVRELSAIADRRMYEAKSAYYRKTGLDRRGHQETVALLINQNAKAKHHVRISIDAEDYYRIKDSEKKEDER